MAPKPEAKAEPETKAAPPLGAKAEPEPEAKAAPQPEAKAEPKPETEPKPEAEAGVARLLNTSLGDLLLAGLVKDPEDAGRIIAAAITQAEAPNATAKTPETEAEPRLKPKPSKPGDKARAPRDATPSAAE